MNEEKYEGFALLGGNKILVIHIPSLFAIISCCCRNCCREGGVRGVHVEIADFGGYSYKELGFGVKKVIIPKIHYDVIHSLLHKRIDEIFING